MTSATFFLDVVHPYCFLALPSVRAAIARGHDITMVPWEKRPAPAALYEPRSDYLRDDWAQHVYPAAVSRGIEIHLPTSQPRSTLACAAYAGYRGPSALDLLDALFRSFFVDGLDLSDDRTLARAAAAVSADLDEVWRGAYDPDTRAQLMSSRAAAAAAGVIEIPALLVDGEQPIIGLDAVERRLALLV